MNLLNAKKCRPQTNTHLALHTPRSNYPLLLDSQAHHKVLKKFLLNKIYNSVAFCATQQTKNKTSPF